MLLIEFLLALVALVFSFMAAVLAINQIKNCPIRELKLLATGFSFTTLYYLGAVVSAVLHTADQADPSGILAYQIGSVMACIALLFISVAVIFTDFQPNYQTLIFVILITIFTTSAALLVSFQLTHEVNGEFIHVVYSPLALLSVGLMVFFAVTLILKRIIEISQLTLENQNPFTTITSLFIFGTLSTVSFVFLLLTGLFPGLGIPGFTWCVPSSLTFLYFTYAFSKDKAFFFVTPATLDAIIITEQASGLPVFTKSFKGGLAPEELLSMIFTTLNISLAHSVQAESRLRHVSFGDKVVLMAPGQQVTTHMIVSERNFATEAICRFLTQKFEKQFQEVLLVKGRGVVVSEFEAFENVISEIRGFLPF
ncbi:MAG: hypothetical protein ACE5OZ_11120 [Candidatus Heimdallarchaeota archaeon]